MNEEESIFGTEPERLMRLMKSGLEADESKEENEAGETAPMESFTGQPGMRIGRYKIIRTLGEGGMGIVYFAEQQGSIRRRVALKVIKPGMDSKRVIARFENERQALALLDHPNIAKVYDAGTTESGRPYFVMEHVKGSPITDYCDHYKLSIEDRLNLFRQVCLAVNHAHQKGIIHRDIKPSNILVSIQDDKPVPKIIDFGVAKALAQPLTERTLATEDSQLLGTPEYMSPEQADMASIDIDTRSDIYSLGVLLYVLLTGVLPFDSTTFRKGGIEHIRQVIRETDPKTPSTRLSKLGEKGKKVAQSRRTEIATLAKKLHKELEWIPLKAMRKERSERYRSASELADDIENYLNGDPLIAGPPGTGYKLKKFVRRNSILVGGITAILFVLIAGIVVSTIFAIGQARARAEAQDVSNFLTTSVLSAVNPLRGGQKETALSILDVVSEGLAGKFENRPLIEASIRLELGRAYWRLKQVDSIIPPWHRAGQPRLDAAEDHLKRAYQLYKEQLGEKEPRTLEAMLSLGAVYLSQGRFDEAEALIASTLEISRRVRGEENPGTLWCMNDLALVYQAQKRYNEAESLFLEMFEISQSQAEFSEDHKGVSRLAEGNLAGLYREQGRYDDAERLYIKLPQWPDIVHYENPSRIRRVSLLAHMYLQQERYDEAESLFLQILENRRIKRGEGHLATLETEYLLGTLYKNQGRYDKAEYFLLEAAWGRHFALGDEHPDTVEALNNLIDLYESWNKPEKAEKWRAKLPQTEAEIE
jgi:tetratricopeptide (TPR) repeat protein/tRNA A-37 threonylcarbamoyl transferase component Bud32